MLRADTRYRAPGADLKIVLGNADAMRPEDNPLLGTRIYWICEDGAEALREPPRACAPTGTLFFVLDFPECWNGALDSADHRSHLAYPAGQTCPGGHAQAIPKLVTVFVYPIGTVPGTITLSSGSIYSAHGDFWNTWNQARLEQLTGSCVNAGVDCGFQQDSVSSAASARVNVAKIRRLAGGSPKRGY